MQSRCMSEFNKCGWLWIQTIWNRSQLHVS